MSGATLPDDTILNRVRSLRRSKSDTAILADLLTRFDLTGDEAQRYLARASLSKFAAPIKASTVSPVSIEWCWQGLVPLGSLSLLYGPEGDGKSTLTMMLAAMATQGTLPGALHGKPTNVELVAYEDDPGAVLVPRLLAAGADLERIFLHGSEEAEPLTLPDDVESFGEGLESRGSRLVIVDPLPDALREGLKDNNNGDVRKAIVPLHRMAQRLGAAVVGVTHPNKSQTDAANKVMGSRAWRSVPRSVLLYGRDPDDPEGPTRIVAVSKTNYAEKVARKVRITSQAVEGVQHSQPRAELVGPSDYRDADLLVVNATGKRGDVKTMSKADQAVDLIYRLLEDGGGEVPAKVAYAAGAALGISEPQMRKARQSIAGLDGGVVWTWAEGVEPPLGVG